jgi:hypothetical protein
MLGCVFYKVLWLGTITVISVGITGIYGVEILYCLIAGLTESITVQDQITLRGKFLLHLI